MYQRVIRSSTSKHRQYNGKKKKNEWSTKYYTENYRLRLQSTEKRVALEGKTVSASLVVSVMLLHEIIWWYVMNEEMTKLLLRQREYIL